MHFYLPLCLHKCPLLAACCRCPLLPNPLPLAISQCFLSLLQSSQSCSSGRQNHVRLQSDSSSSTQVSSTAHAGGPLAAPRLAMHPIDWFK